MSGSPDIKPIDALTGLRGVAAIWVVAYHFRELLFGYGSDFALGLLGHGFLAVDVFFVLSGFIIYLNYRWIFDDFSLRSIGRFSLARLARIYPVHFFVSLLYLLNPLAILAWSHRQDLGTRYDAGYYVLSLLLVHNWGLTDYVAWNIPSWSISTEWFAYLLFPCLLFCVRHNATKPLLVVVEAVGILAVLASACALAGWRSIGDDIPHFGLVRCVLEFAAGTAVCRLYLLTKNGGAGLSRILPGAIVLCVLATIGFDLPDFVLLPTAFAALILSLTDKNTALSRLFARPVLVGLGEISYSIYMIHYFVRDWMKFADLERFASVTLIFFFYLACVLCAGALVYVAIERPGRRFFRGFVMRRA